jgi:hypothetical protein
MDVSRAQPPLAAAAVSLVVWGACVAALLPPLNADILESVPLTVLLGLAIAASLVLHLVFVGIAARRLGRSSATWVALALVTFPIGSIVGLVLVEWFGQERVRANADGVT